MLAEVLMKRDLCIESKITVNWIHEDGMYKTWVGLNVSAVQWRWLVGLWVHGIFYFLEQLHDC